MGRPGNDPDDANATSFTEKSASLTVYRPPFKSMYYLL
jgi:hypothetical protein